MSLHIRPDLIGHAKAGLQAAAFGVVQWALMTAPLVFLGVLPAVVPLLGACFAAPLASTVAGITKEACDKEANNRLTSAGMAPMFGVDPKDAMATAAPGFLLCALGLVGVYAYMLAGL